MLVAMCAATFVVTSSGSGTAPFLSMIAADLYTDLPTVAHLFSVQAIAWGTASLVGGVFSERFGRRGSCRLHRAGRSHTPGFAAAHTYGELVTWQVVSGLGGGAFMGTVYTTVSDHVAAGARGRAMSWVITGQSLSLVLGVPIVTLLGALGGWRGAIAAHGTIVVLTAIAVRLATPPDPAHHPVTRAM
jgi:DHA1 family inner membrane transport protein